MRPRYFFHSLLFLFFCFNSSVSFAQYAYWGFKGGIQATKLSGVSFESKMSPGFSLGLFGNFILSDKVALQHEILYSHRGFSGTTTDSIAISGNLPYIDLPWLLHYNVNKVFHIQAGVQPSLYLFYKKSEPTSSEYSKYNVNPIDFSGLLGVGAILRNNVLFGIRLNVSFGQTFNTTAFGGRNVSLQAYLGYSVNRKIKKKKKK